MADHTQIEWTDATWNPITGCSVHSPGCTNCYAMKLAGTRLAQHPSRAGLTRETKTGPVWTGEVRFNEEWLTQPLKWKRPRRIFVCAHADLFHEAVPDEWIDRVFAVMVLAPEHQFQVLTKRSARMRVYCQSRFETEAGSDALCEAIDDLGQGVDPTDWTAPLPNVWLGVSVEDQTRADERIPDLLATPAAVRWISAEPLLGPVDLTDFCTGFYFTNPLTGHRYHDALDDHRSASDYAGVRLDWVVVGGESGPGARPMHPDWARSLRDQCQAAGVPFAFKQWGDWAPEPEGDPDYADGQRVADISRVYPADHKLGGTYAPMRRVGKEKAGRLLDGEVWDQFPKQAKELADG